MKRIIDFENVKWDEETKIMFEDPEVEKDMKVWDAWLEEAENYTMDDYITAVRKWNADPTKNQKLSI